MRALLGGVRLDELNPDDGLAGFLKRDLSEMGECTAVQLSPSHRLAPVERPAARSPAPSRSDPVGPDGVMGQRPRHRPKPSFGEPAAWLSMLTQSRDRSAPKVAQQLAEFAAPSQVRSSGHLGAPLRPRCVGRRADAFSRLWLRAAA